MKFINIHTHQNTPHEGEWSIYNNRAGFDAQIYTNTPFSIGIHPWDAHLSTKSTFSLLESYLKHPNCKALGECGLDKLSSNFEQQQPIFSNQLQLANLYKKPVIIHCVKAFDELIEITTLAVKTTPLIIHGFNKSEELAKQLINKGFYLSLHPSFIQKMDVHFYEIAIDKLFLETDNNPKTSINEVYQSLAQKLNIDLEVLKTQINRNFDSLFL